MYPGRPFYREHPGFLWALCRSPFLHRTRVPSGKLIATWAAFRSSDAIKRSIFIRGQRLEDQKIGDINTVDKKKHLRTLFYLVIKPAKIILTPSSLKIVRKAPNTIALTSSSLGYAHRLTKRPWPSDSPPTE